MQNDGEAIAETNYWDSAIAAEGFFFLSGNAGVLRLLVPDTHLAAIEEFRTASRVLIEESAQLGDKARDIVFEDGSPTPYVVMLDKRLIDRKLDEGNCPLHVWTRAGKVLTFDCAVVSKPPKPGAPVRGNRH